MITKSQLRTKFTLQQIGNILGITKGAVGHWPDNEPIDLKYEYIIRHHDDPEIKGLWEAFNQPEEVV